MGSTILLYGGMIAVLYFMLIMPQQKQQKKLKLMRETLELGSKVITIGGLVGTIKALRDDEVTLEVNETGGELTYKKWAIGRLYDDTSK